jgi:DNA-binding transcriptional ArsR family regulator
MTADTLVPIFAALADDTRWAILVAVGDRDLSASALSRQLPVSRQAIAKHLAALESAHLVEAMRVGRELRYRAIGATLSATARRLEAIGAEWDQRLLLLKQAAERG